MDNKLLQYAYAGLLHDIGKFYQRTEVSSSLTEEEKENTPWDKNNIYHTHLHSGYTSRFFRKYLGLYNSLERSSSIHHIQSLDEEDVIIRKADILASRIDRNDENSDFDDAHKRTRYSHITTRLHSILSEIDFGKSLQNSTFNLSSLDNISLPKETIDLTKEEASLEYKELFNQFVEEVQKDNKLKGDVTPYRFNRMYSLLYKYTTLIPASTYETKTPSVSLFDHMKLTAAIASCLYYNNCNSFYMFEFDISGIQKFIYHVTEGKDTKDGVAKSLRGRSAFVSLLSNAITYAVLNEFKLTQANIIFNTGGGGILLLPYLEDTETRLRNLCKEISKNLYRKFNTSLTFVYALESVDEHELELFKSEKAMALKTQLEIAKKQKYMDLIDDDFSLEHLEGQHLCQLCGDILVEKEGDTCTVCQSILKISDFYTRHQKFSVFYTFNNQTPIIDEFIDFGFAKVVLTNERYNASINSDVYYYQDAFNHYECGNVKLVANLVPKKDGIGLNFEDIAKSLDKKKYGDTKLAILKMDVDNLGAVFAFGLKQEPEKGKRELQRSLSKYLTLSRFMELFFSQELVKICKEVSTQLQTQYDNLFYINYAGGDDLVIIGPVYGIVQLASEIRQRFKAFVRNDNITLSGGIHVQGSKKPIRFGVKEADEQLEKSKAYSFNGKTVKDAISLMDLTIAFDEFEALLNKVETYREYIQEGKISRTSFYNIMSNIRCQSMDDYYQSIPIIEYGIYRQLGNHPLRTTLIKDITKATNLYELNKIILMMKLVILFTREG